MSARKLNKEVPEHLKSLMTAPAREVVIGDSLYEICQIPHAEFAQFERQVIILAKNLMDQVKKAKDAIPASEEGDLPAEATEAMEHLLTNSKILATIAQTVLCDVDKEDMEKATATQILHATTMWLDLNIFTMPKETWQAFLRLFSAFS